MNKQSLRGYLLILAAALSWGWIPVFSRIAYQYGSNPQTAAAFRSFVAAPVFLIWLLAKGSLKQFKLKDLPIYLVYGIVAYAGTCYFYMAAVQLLTSAMAAILLYTSAAFIIILNRLIYKDAITRDKIIALLCTFFGCFLVVRAYDPGAFLGNMKGILFGLASGLCYSMTTVMGTSLRKKNPGEVNSGLMTIFGALVFLIVCPPWKGPAPSLPLMGAYLGLGIVCSVMGFGFYLKGMEQGIDGGVAGIIAMIEPVAATILGCLFFRDAIAWPQIVGIAVVLFGAAWPILAERRENAASSGLTKVKV